MPIRIQRKRTKGWQMPENTVYVGRPSIYGNEFDYQKLGREEAVMQYTAWIENHIKNNTYIAKIVAELRGKNLACWCKLDQPCHADVLLRKANALTNTEKE